MSAERQPHEMLRRVAVTGRGILLPNGSGPRALIDFELSRDAFPATIADFNAADFIDNAKVLRAMHRTFQLAAAAAVLAMREGGLASAQALMEQGIEPVRAGTAVSMAEISPVTSDLVDTLRQTAPDGGLDLVGFGETAMHTLHPFRRLSLLLNMAAAHVSLLFGLQGPSFTLNSGTQSAAQAARESFWTIAHGRADLMICEAADSPAHAFRGTPVLEAAAALVFEEWTSAERRGAPIVAEVIASDIVGHKCSPAFQDAPATAGLLELLLNISNPEQVFAGGLKVIPAVAFPASNTVALQSVALG